MSGLFLSLAARAAGLRPEGAPFLTPRPAARFETAPAEPEFETSGSFASVPRDEERPPEPREAVEERAHAAPRRALQGRPPERPDRLTADRRGMAGERISSSLPLTVPGAQEGALHPAPPGPMPPSRSGSAEPIPRAGPVAVDRPRTVQAEAHAPCDVDAPMSGTVAPLVQEPAEVSRQAGMVLPQRERETARFAPLVAPPARTPPAAHIPPPVNVSIGRIEVSLAPPPQDRSPARPERVQGFAGYEGARRGRR